MSANNTLVLLTGATGHIGFRVLLDLLTAGYKVRAAVRSEAKEKTILTNPTFKALNAPSSLLSFVIVPDLQAKGAYDEAVKGVDYVIHLASPITTGASVTTEEYHEYFIKPAVRGTMSMLEAAAASPSVKRVVITSSVVAIVPFVKFTNPMSDSDLYNAESRIPTDQGPYTSEFQAYSASKAAALNEAEAWVAEKKPSFDLVHIHPSFVEGRDDLALTPKATIAGTNAVILNVILGVKNPNPSPGVTVHNEDVARLHVEALNPKIPAGSYVAHSNNPAGTLNGTRWEDTNAIVAKLFPEALKKGLIRNDGEQKSVLNHVDAKKTEDTFGWKLQSFEKQVESVVGHYVELLEKKA